MAKSLWIASAIFLTTSLMTEQTLADEAEILRRLERIEDRLQKLEEKSINRNILSEALKGVMETPSAGTATEDQKADKSDLVNTPPPFKAKLVSIKKTGQKSALDMPLYEIVIEVTNESKQSTSIINAFVDIKDKADNLIAKIKWDGNKGIASGKTRTIKGTYADNPFEQSRLERLYEIDKELVDAQFNVYKIVFSDGSVVEYKECIMCEF